MSELREFKRRARLMGSSFEFIIVAKEEEAESLLEDCILETRRIENLFTEFSEVSDTTLINRHAGIHSVQVSEEVVQLITRCQQLHKLTQGAFDITAAVLKKLYHFRGASFEFPGEDKINAALKKVGTDKIVIKGSKSVFLKEPGMHIAFGAIGKGYAADKVKQLMVGKGIASGVINASGDLTAWGKRPDGSPWKIGIADPVSPEKIIMWIPVDNQSVATSGDYEQFFEYKDTRYSHTIDPKTGIPTSGIKSVTVVSSSAELSDALATAVFIMGKEVGLHFIEQLPKTHVLIVNDENEVFTSKDLSVILKNE